MLTHNPNEFKARLHGPDKFGTGPLRDLIGSVPKGSHERGPKIVPDSQTVYNGTG